MSMKSCLKLHVFSLHLFTEKSQHAAKIGTFYQTIQSWVFCSCCQDGPYSHCLVKQTSNGSQRERSKFETKARVCLGETASHSVYVARQMRPLMGQTSWQYHHYQLFLTFIGFLFIYKLFVSEQSRSSHHSNRMTKYRTSSRLLLHVAPWCKQKQIHSA
jgi:hypothetical protein